MWEQTFKRWIDLVFWWLPKGEATQQPAPQASQAAADRAPQQAAPQAKEPDAEGTPRKTPRSKAPAAEAMLERAASKQAARPSAPDDLTVIKGIGPAVQKKLHALGIRTFDDLAAADPATLVEQLKGRQPISQGQVRSWTKAADQRAARH